MRRAALVRSRKTRDIQVVETIARSPDRAVAKSAPVATIENVDNPHAVVRET
jgi:hypothetical protein